MKEKKIWQKHEFCTKGKVHIMGKFLFRTFWRWEIRSSFDSKTWCKMTFSLAWNTMFFVYGKVLVLDFPEIKNTVFFYLKSWWKVNIFLVCLNFLWYSWTIRRHVRLVCDIYHAHTYLCCCDSTVFCFRKQSQDDWFF